MAVLKHTVVAFIASLPILVISSPPFRWQPITSLTKPFPRLIPSNEPTRIPWIIDRGGASNMTNEDDDPSLIFFASKSGDGSESDPDGIPDRFLRMQKGNRHKAKAAFAETVKWREEKGVNMILSRPHTKFDLCKAIFPVYIPGRDVEGNLIIVQRLGLFDVDVLHKNNVTSDEVLLHYIYVVEYCWNILDPEPDRKMTVILDMEGLGFKTFRDKDKRNFALRFVKTMSDHYPQRSFKTLVINTPSWFDLMYKIVKPLLRESTKAKISIVRRGHVQDKLLIKVLGIESVPREILYDQSCLKDIKKTDGELEAGNNSRIEQGLRLFVSSNRHYP